jgi:hypothetical protein
MPNVNVKAVRSFLEGVKHDYPQATAAIQDVLDAPDSLERLSGILDRVMNGPTLHAIAAMNATIDVDRVSSLEQAKELLGRIRDEAKTALTADTDPLRAAVAQVINQASRPNGELLGAVTVQVPLTLMKRLQNRLGADPEMDDQNVRNAGARSWGAN